jgi:hypothetical protein
MGLAQVQQVLAHLYIDAALRERFFADPQRTGAELGLDAREVQHLAQLSAHQVAFFARSLQRKRLQAIRKLLPLTHRVLKERFGALFERYSERPVPQGSKKHRADAIAFAAFVEHALGVHGTVPLWVVELVRYEAAWLRAADPTCRWMGCWFHYPMRELVRRVAQLDTVPTPGAQPTLALWCRFAQRGRLWHVALALPRLARR